MCVCTFISFSLLQLPMDWFARLARVPFMPLLNKGCPWRPVGLSEACLTWQQVILCRLDFGCCGPSINWKTV